MEWSPSGRLLCTGSLDKMAQIWSISWANATSSEGAKPSSDPASGYLNRLEAGVFANSSLVAKSMWRLRGHEGRITCVRFVPGESHLLTGTSLPPPWLGAQSETPVTLLAPVSLRGVGTKTQAQESIHMRRLSELVLNNALSSVLWLRTSCVYASIH